MKISFLFRKYHKWLALIVGIQALVWCFSGLYMTAIHIEYIHGDHLINNVKQTPINREGVTPLNKVFLSSIGKIKNIQLTLVNNSPTYLIETEKSNFRINAISLHPQSLLNAKDIEKIATEIYAGESKLNSVELLENYPKELGGRKEPIWKVTYDDWLNSTLYFLPDNGRLRSKRSDLWRWFDFLWMLHIMDYDTREDVNNSLLRVFASLGLLLVLSGVGLLFFSFKNQKAKGTTLVGKLKIVHKWLALFIGLQLVLWMVSGLMFSLLSHKEVGGNYLFKRMANVSWQGVPVDFLNILDKYENIVAIQSKTLQGNSVYLVKTKDSQFIVDSKLYNKIHIDKDKAREIALASYVGDGQLKSIKRETERTTENRRYLLPVWQAIFSDEQNSSLYISANTGQIYGIKTDTWRLFDIFWMLHIMDYSERKDFNNSLIVFSVSLSIFIALTGILLWFYVFTKNDFRFFSRFKRVPLVIKSEAGFSSEVAVPKNQSLYHSLSLSGYELPSNCGGGGSCGLCRVQLNASSDISDADKQLLTNNELNQGVRLACQQQLTQGLEVTVSEQVLNQRIVACRIVNTRLVTPLIKEISLQLPKDLNFDFRAGEYVLVHIPQGSTDFKNLKIESDYQDYWSKHQLFKYTSERKEYLTRAYSMANPPTNSQNIVLNVRLALPLTKAVEIGKASSFLFAANKGNEIKISGPFGNFHAEESDREMLFIGGGAGMAPLRSHILYQLNTLKTKRKISFWFGARNQQEIFYRNEFDQLDRKYENFNWHIALSEAAQDESWLDYKGMIHEVVKREYLAKHRNLGQCEFYVCGPSLMNQAVYSILKEFDIADDLIKIDEFS